MGRIVKEKRYVQPNLTFNAKTTLLNVWFESKISPLCM